MTRSPAKATCLVAAYSEPVFMDCHCSCWSVLDHSCFGCGAAPVLREKATSEGAKRSTTAMKFAEVWERGKFDLKKEKMSAPSTSTPAMTAMGSIKAE